LEGDQVVKEARIREANHQVSIAGEKLKTTSKNMSKNYEESLLVYYYYYLIDFKILYNI